MTAIVDPRERYDDLLVTTGRERLGPQDYQDVAASEAATVGWVTLAFAFHADGRVLLVAEPWADGWLAPGGVPKPGESLAEAVTREVREETGIEVASERPYALYEHTFVDERTGESDGWTTVFFGATAATTTVDDDPGLDDEEITEAGWFDGLPDDVFKPSLSEPAYRRCRAGLSWA